MGTVINDDRIEKPLAAKDDSALRATSESLLSPRKAIKADVNRITSGRWFGNEMHAAALAQTLPKRGL